MAEKLRQHRQMVTTAMGPVCMSDDEVLDYEEKLAAETPEAKAKRLRRMTHLKAVLFDMDGVIFDSERWVMAGWQHVAGLHDIPDVENTVQHCFGRNYDGQRAVFKQFYGDDFPFEAYKSEVTNYFFGRYDKEGHLPLKPGVNAILDFLREHGIAIALATSTRQQIVTKELADAGIIKKFDEIICGDMVKRSKPAPDIFMTAAEAVDTAPKDCAVIEDSYNGIRAANAAGCRPIMVPDMVKPDDEMTRLVEIILPDLSSVQTYFKYLVE